MNKFAVAQARNRLDRARRAVAEMRAEPRGFDDIQRAWFDFLLAANGVFVKLQKGAQNNPATQRWWGKLKQRRKDDELLSYLHHARRVEEHGLSFSTQMSGPHIEWVPQDYTIPGDRKGKELLVNVGIPGKLLKTTLPTSLQLNDIVDDQYGDVFPWPKTHLGRAIAEQVSEYSIPAIAELAISTLESIIDEAAQLVPSERHKPSLDKPTEERG